MALLPFSFKASSLIPGSLTSPVVNEVRKLHCLLKQGLIAKDNTIQFFFKNTPVKFHLPKSYNDFLQQHVMYHESFFEADLLEYVNSTYALDGKTVLDIGAHIGNHSVYFSKIARAKQVIAFEPQTEMSELFKQNIALNQLDDTVVLNACALGRKKSKASITNYVNSNHGMQSLKTDDDGHISVEALDDFKLKPDFIKIDVEGFELDVLEGAAATIEKHRPIIWIEIWPENVSAVHSWLSDSRYKQVKKLTEHDYLYEPL